MTRTRRLLALALVLCFLFAWTQPGLAAPAVSAPKAAVYTVGRQVTLQGIMSVATANKKFSYAVLKLDVPAYFTLAESAEPNAAPPPPHLNSRSLAPS